MLTLSGGALGISFAFVKDFVGTNYIIQSNLFYAAWFCWGISVSCALYSFLSSSLASRHAIKQIDSDKIYSQHPGGLLDIFTAILNISSGLLFLIGVVLITIFVSYNMS